MSEKIIIEQAAQRLLAGQVIGYPTETVWGLAATPEHMAELWRRKGRESGKPLQISCADRAAALELAQPDPVLELLSAFWPGPLTVVTLASAQCPAGLAPGGWVGLRLPDHPVAQSLLRFTGSLATTSLNLAGQSAAVTYEQAQAYALADLLLGQPQDRAGGLASTVIRLPERSGQPAQVLRAGALPLAEIAAVLGTAGVKLAETS